MAGLSKYDPRWDQARAAGAKSRVYEDESTLLATDFEGGNGADLKKMDNDLYCVTLEPEPGNHRYGHGERI